LFVLDRTVKIYDVSGDNYTHTATLQNHTGPVWSLSWSHPKYGSLLASASFDGSVLIHREIRPREWTLIYGQAPSSTTNTTSSSSNNQNTTPNTPTLHESSVNDVSFAPHEYGLILAGCSSDGKVSILTHTEDNDWLVEYIQDNALGVNCMSWAPYTAYEGSVDDNEGTATTTTTSQMRLVTGGCDNQIRFWTKSPSTSGGATWTEDSSNQPISSSSATHSDWIRDVAWSPSIIPNTNIIASCSEDRTVIIWTQRGGVGNEWDGVVLHTFEDPVWRLSWNMTGSILAVSSGDSNVTLWKQDLNEMWTQVSSVEESVGANGGNSDE
jgi:protein transport protein SEC13